MEGEVAAALMKVIAVITRQASRELSTTALLTMAFLSDEGPQRITDLALAQAVTQPTMTVLVANLEAAGYAVRRKDDADGRVTLACLTETGERFIADQRREGVQTLARLISKLSDDRRAALASALPALIEVGDLGRGASS